MKRALLGIVAVAVSAVAVPAVSQGADPLTTDDLSAYEGWFVAVGRDLGRLVQEGTADARSLKATVGSPPPAREKDTLLVALRRIAERVEAVAAPEGLEQAHDRLRAAVASYAGLVAALPDVDRAVALGKQADAQYDASSAVIQSARARFGLPSNPELPDPDRPLPPGVEVVNP